MSGLTRDVQWAIRGLARRPGFFAVAVLTLALGIGATTSMFSVLHGVVIKPLAFNEPERIVALYTTTPERSRPPWSGANYVDFVADSSAYEALAGFRIMDYSLAGNPYPSRMMGASVTTDFFGVFKVPPFLGRTFSSTEEDDRSGSTAVVSFGFWQSRFAGDPEVVGTSFDLNGESFLLVGVMPRGFAYPEGAEIWTASRYRAPETPVNDGTDLAEDRDRRYFGVVARLRQGVSVAQAQEEGTGIISRLARDFPENNRDLGFEAVPLHERVVGSVRPMLLILTGAVSLLLVIACTNVSSLLLARAAGRSHELAVCTALGASRGRIARTLLTESLVLGVVGGVCGVALAVFGTRGLLALASSELPRVAEVGMNGAVLTFALVISLLAGLLFGLAPAAM